MVNVIVLIILLLCTLAAFLLV